MYGIFTYVYHQNQPNVGKYTIHGWYGLYFHIFPTLRIQISHLPCFHVGKHILQLDFL